MAGGRGGRPRLGDRVVGPHRAGDGWEYAIYEGSTVRRCRCRPGTTRAEAEEIVEGARDELVAPGVLTVAEAVDRYATQIGKRSDRPQSETFARAALKPLVDACPADMLVSMLTARQAERYLDAISERSMATQRSYWKGLVRFSAWLEAREMVTRNVTTDCLTRRARRDEPLPWRTRGGARKISRGKPQLRNLHEVGAYLAAVAHLRTPEERVAAAMPVLTGVASGEVLHLRAGDVDFDAGKVWIRGDEAAGGSGDWAVKTGHRERTVELPDALAGDLRALSAGKAPTAYLLTRAPRYAGGVEVAGGVPHGRHWLASLVRQVCESAGVRVVPPHGLRGTHTSMRLALAGKRIAGLGDAVTLEEIAKELGHADDGETARRHYKGAPEHVPALKMVAGGDTR